MRHKWMQKDGESERVLPEQVEEFLAKGFRMGRPFRRQSAMERLSRSVPHMTNRKLLKHGVSLEQQRSQREAGNKWCGWHKNYEHASLFHQGCKQCKDGQREADREEYSKFGRDRKYKVPKNWRERMMSRQNGHCALCPATESSQGRRLAVDHDHKCCPMDGRSCGKCVRGLLCDSCNTKLDYLEKLMAKGVKIEDPDPWTRDAMKYLVKYSLTLQLSI